MVEYKEVDKNKPVCYKHNKEYLEKLGIYDWLWRNNFYQGMRHDCLIVEILEKIKQIDSQFTGDKS